MNHNTTIVLVSDEISGEDGYCVHGVFPSMASALKHIYKDNDSARPMSLKHIYRREESAPIISQPTESIKELEIVINQTRWKAFYTPIRNEDGL